jgi:amidase
MTAISRRAFAALSVAGLAARAHAKAPAPAVRPAWSDAVETAAMIRAGEVSAVEVTERAIAAAQRLQPKLNFLVASDFDRALARARAGGQTGPFAGVPFLIKDLDDLPGLPTRSGSRAMLPAPPATRQSPLIEAYLRTGVDVIGKSATPEFGFLPTTEPTAFGRTRNPWDTARSSGGSSGGSAVATATGVVPFAHATDGGGSIRIPASCCGLFGLKPSRGRMAGTRTETTVQDFGVEHVLTRSVRDSAVMFAASEDAAAGAQHAPVGLVTTPLKRRLRVGLLMDGGAGKPPEPEVRAATEATVKLLESLGHRVVPTKWPTGPEFIDDFLQLWASGAAGLAASLTRMSGHPPTADQLEAFTLGMADMSARAPRDALPQAIARLQANAQAYDPWFASQKLDVVLSPVLAAPPPPLGFIGPDVPFDTLVARLIDYVGYTPYHNIAGGPAMSVPLNWTPGGLPVGAMFSAPVGGEGLLLQLAYQLEAAHPWADKAPPIRA